MRLNFRFYPRSLLFHCVMVAIVCLVLGAFSITPADLVRIVRGAAVQVLKNFHLIRLDDPPPRQPQILNTDSPDIFKETLLHRPMQSELFSPALKDISTTDEAALKTCDSVVEDYQKTLADKPDRAERYRAILQRVLEEANAATPEDWSEIRAGLEQAAPLLQELKSSGSGDGFQPDLLYESRGKSRPGMTVSQLVEDCAGMLCLKSLASLKMQNVREALETACLAARLAMVQPFTQAAMQKAQARSFGKAVNTWSRAVASTNDPHALNQSLDAMNSLAAKYQINLDNVFDPVSRDLLSRIRMAADGKDSLNLSRTTPDYLLQQYTELTEKKLEAEKRRLMEDEPRFRTEMEKHKKEIDELSRAVKEAMETRGMPGAGRDNATSAPLHPQLAAEKMGQAELDILRLSTAEKLFRGQYGREPSSLDSLSPRYFPTSSSDPFTNQPYLVDPASGRVYSAGPDLVDQQGKVRYDPTNGSRSAGDIFLPLLDRASPPARPPNVSLTSSSLAGEPLSLGQETKP